jgi:hypothetical protein
MGAASLRPHARSFRPKATQAIGPNPVPICFGANPSGDAMYLAGRVVSLRMRLVDARCSMSFVIEVGSLRADGRYSPRMACGGPV